MTIRVRPQNNAIRGAGLESPQPLKPVVTGEQMKRATVWGAIANSAREVSGFTAAKTQDTSAQTLAKAVELISLGKKEGREALEALVTTASASGELPKVLSGIIDAGKYEDMLDTLGKKSGVLKLLAEARPTYDEAKLNAATEAKVRAHPEWQQQFEHDVLIIPGFTPIKANKPMTLDEIPAARQRLDLAIEDFKSGKAPVILVSGGSVHPSGTPHNEGLMMRQYLIDKGVPADRILVDAHARHSTTNLRNAGRMMNDLGLKRGLIATGFESKSSFDQHFYFARPVLSTFHLRSKSTLGYQVGQLKNVDRHHIAFKPSSKCARVDYSDPLDP